MVRRGLLSAIAAALLTCGSAIGHAATAPAAPAAPGATVVPPVCDRACLNGMIDAYLAALVAKAPSRLPLTKDARFTENGVTLKLGDGLWGTVDGVGDYKLTFVDPETGQAGAFVTIKESGRQVLLGLRLQIQSGNRISQIETVVSRGGLRPGAPAPVMTVNPVFQEAVPAGERRSRAQMMAITNSYFDGLEFATGKLTPFDAHCQRIENGAHTSGYADGGSAMVKMTCGEQFDTGFSPFITNIRERRFPIMDQEKGLGFAQVFFDHAGTIKDVKMADGTTLHVPPPFDAPYSFEIFEVFKIQNGKIVRVEAILNTVPYGMPSGW
jgi:hypothetical protein